MTQNVITLQTPKGAVNICMGWDRALQELFCNLILLDAQGQEDIEGDDDDDLRMPLSFPGGVAQIRECLKERNFEVPAVLFEKLELDMRANAGNIIRQFAPDGTLVKEQIFGAP